MTDYERAEMPSQSAAERPDSTLNKTRFSIMLPTFLDPDSRKPYEPTVTFAQRVDELGFYMGTFGHHAFTPEIGDPSAPFVLLAAVAARTEHLRLGSGIYLAALHHPVTVAEQAATLDQISGGRAVLGVGVGYRDYEYRGFGLDFAARGRRMDELLTVLRTGWQTGAFEFAGNEFQIPKLPVHPPCVQQPHMPILVGGSAPAAIHRAARLGDGWFALPQESLTVMQHQVDLYREACRAAGREPYICLMRNAWIAPTQKQVEAEWLPRMIAFHKSFADARATRDDAVIEKLLAGEAFTLEEYIYDRAIAGTPEGCIEQIERWQQAIQPDEFSLIFGGSNDPQRLDQAVSFFAREVMTHFASA